MRRSFCPCKRRCALTRLELLLAIVLGLFALGLFLTYLARQRESGLREYCVHHLRRIGMATLGFHDEKKFLPAARIADGYATWPVQIIAHLEKDSPLVGWDLGRRYADQPESVRQALVSVYLCPARKRTTYLSKAGGPQDPTPGSLGDYACASGDGDPGKPWTGRLANGPIIVGEVLEERDGAIQRWQARTSLASLTRGQSYTLLVGDKHVPTNHFGDVHTGDGSLYNGALPESSARVGGPTHPLATDAQAPYQINFGSAHTNISQFLHGDGSVRPYANAMSPELLAQLIRRD